MKERKFLITLVANMFQVLFLLSIYFWFIFNKTNVPVFVIWCIGFVAGYNLFILFHWFKGFWFYWKTKDPILMVTVKQHLLDASPLQHANTTLSACHGAMKAVYKNYPNPGVSEAIDELEWNILAIKHNEPR